MNVPAVLDEAGLPFDINAAGACIVTSYPLEQEAIAAAYAAPEYKAA